MKPTKMRNKRIYRATNQVVNKQISAPLSKDLRKKYTRRSVRIMVDDTAKVIRGEYKGITGKVSKISTNNSSIAIEGNKKEKLKGDKIDVYIHSSNVIVTSLNTDDKWRIKILEKKPKSKIKSMKADVKKKDDVKSAAKKKDNVKSAAKKKDDVKSAAKKKDKISKKKDKKECEKIMGSIAGSKKLKRQMAPTFWGINRKEKRFVITVRPGSHPKNNSIPTAVLLRDTIKKVKTLREAKSSIYGGKIKVDGIIQKSLHHSIGLMDVVELEGTTDVYRLIPKNGHILEPLKINANEKSKKLVKVNSKTTIKGGKTQLGFHDGRTIITDVDTNVDDTCLLQIPEQKILDVIKFEKNSQVIVTRGINAGRIGIINELKQGTFTLPKRINLLIDDKTIEIPANITMVVGKEKPLIQIR